MRATTTAPGRNDPCACGSGRKYKRCCEGKPAGRRRLAGLLLGLLLLAAAILFVEGLRSGQGWDSPGRVWSAEHGHWHDGP